MSTAAAPIRRILVTGGAGFVGGHLLPALRDAFGDAETLLLQADLTDGGAVRDEVARVRPDACVHLAAVSDVPAAQADPTFAWRVNLEGTLVLARAIAGLGGGSLLYVSSGDAYGRTFQRGEPVDETAPLAPLNMYGATKAAADLALGAMAKELHVIRVRPFNHIGPGQSDRFAVAAFARQLALIAAGRQAPALEVGALDPRRDFLDVRDVCRAYVACLRHREAIPSGAILNVCAGQSRSIRSVLDDLVRLSGLDVAIRVDPARLRPSEIPVAAGNPSAACALLGWQPAMAWEQTLADILADWRRRIDAEPA